MQDTEGISNIGGIRIGTESTCFRRFDREERFKKPACLRDNYFEDHNLQKILVNFEIPFLLRVEDSINDEPPKYTVNIEGCEIGVDFEKNVGGTNSVKMAVQSHSDRLGGFSTTRCQIEFGSEYLSEVLDELEGSPNRVRSSSGGGLWTIAREQVTMSLIQ